MKKHTRLTALITAIITALSLIGCSVTPKETSLPSETTVHTTIPMEATAVVPTQGEADISPELSSQRDPEKICLHLRPTGVVTQGEDCRYYTPQNQDVWRSAWESAAKNRVPESYWQEEDRSSGVWLRYRDAWWRLLENGDILTLSHERIAAEHCRELTALVEEAMDQLGMAPPVRPEQIQSIRKATLEWDGSHTITDPEKLSSLETLLSGSQELAAGASCWFTALLTLELENGEQLKLSMATDSCGTWLSQGVFYEYSQAGNEEFYTLFESQSPPEPTQPQSTTAPTVLEPEEDALVRVADYLPDAVQDLRYATEDNFTGQRVYDFTEAYLRFGTVKKLQKVSEDLASQGYRLVIWDAFRPVSAQQALWDICPDPNYVSHPETGNRNHCRGNAVDLTLADEQGNPVEMPSKFDDFTAKADRDYSDCSAEAAANARLLQDTMERSGFTGYEKEWWHFNDDTSYPVEETFAPQPESLWIADCNEFITLRQRASTSAEAITGISAGERVTLLADCGDFAFVEYQGQTGYVLTSYLKPAESTVSPEPEALWAANCEEFISLRKHPGGLEVLAKIPAGETMEVKGWSGKYAQVRYQEMEGYVLSSYIKPKEDLEGTLSVVAFTDCYSYEQMLQDMDSLCGMRPDLLTKDLVGYSQLGREIPVLRLGSEDAGRHVLFQGAIHGREHMTAWLLMALADAWSGGDGDMFQDVCVHIIPMVNSDGVTISQTGRLEESQLDIYRQDREKGYTNRSQEDYAAQWKANGLGVDLNRNFPAGWEELESRSGPSSEKYRGEEPFSATETAALRDYTLSYPFAATISYHASGSVIYYNYGSKEEVNARSNELAQQIRAVTGYTLESGLGLDGAGYKDWCIQELEIPSVTVEIGCQAVPLHQREIYSIFVRNKQAASQVIQWMGAE